MLVTLAERQQKSSDVEGNHVQNWLHNTLHGTKDQSDRPEGTRHLSVVLTIAFTLGVLMSFLSLLDFQRSGQDVLCIIVVAWAGISIACGKLAGLLRITFDLKRLGTGMVEQVAAWVVLALSFGATLAHVTISIGATRDVPELPNISLCYRRHFLITSLLVSLLNITLELYFMGRMFFLLVPEFLQFHHKVEIMMDVRVARVASILILDLLMLLPSALSINLAAEFIPFSLGALLVLAAFNHHPSKPTDASSFRMTASHRTSVLTFPRDNQPDDDHSIVSEQEPTATKSDKPTSLLPTTPTRKSSLVPSEPAPKRQTPSKSRDLRASHISYDSEAEARSVRGAVVSIAFKSHEIEPMPAIPYGIYQPKLVGSPVLMARASQQPSNLSNVSGSDAASLSHSSLSQKPLPVPKPSLGAAQLPTPVKDYLRPTDSLSSSIVYGSDVIRRPASATSPTQKSRVSRPESASTMKTVSHVTSSHSHGYTGPDLRHYSMGSQSVNYETRDYLGTPPRPTGLVRMSTFGAKRGLPSGVKITQEQTRI